MDGGGSRQCKGGMIVNGEKRAVKDATATRLDEVNEAWDARSVAECLCYTVVPGVHRSLVGESVTQE